MKVLVCYDNNFYYAIDNFEELSLHVFDKLYNKANIIGECDDKLHLIPNRYNVDLSKYDNSVNIYDITCAKCEHMLECYFACKCLYPRIDDCLIRQLAAKHLESSNLKDEAYYAAEDQEVIDLFSLQDTAYKWYVLLDPVKILK